MPKIDPLYPDTVRILCTAEPETDYVEVHCDDDDAERGVAYLYIREVGIGTAVVRLDPASSKRLRRALKDFEKAAKV